MCTIVIIACLTQIFSCTFPYTFADWPYEKQTNFYPTLTFAYLNVRVFKWSRYMLLGTYSNEIIVQKHSFNFNFHLSSSRGSSCHKSSYQWATLAQELTFFHQSERQRDRVANQHEQFRILIWAIDIFFLATLNK